MPTKKEILEKIPEFQQDFIWGRQSGKSILCGYNIAIRNIKRVLDELEKPVEIKHCLTEWIQESKRLFNDTPHVLLSRFWNEYSEGILSEELTFYGVSDKNIEIINQAILTGNYTVKKEQLYRMPVPYQINKTLFYYIDQRGEISFRQGNVYKFTKDQIEKYFPEIKDMKEETE